MPRRSDSRFKMIAAAAQLFRQRGYHATAFSDVIQASGAPRGSTYFHFPGGKQELAREAIVLAGDEIEQMVAEAAARCDGPGSFVRTLGDMVAARLESSDYRSGCAIATMVLELAPQNEELSSEFEKVFGRWRQALARQFGAWGIAAGRATDLADLVMSVFEGGLVVSRAARRIDSFRTAIEELAELVEHQPRLSAGNSHAARADRAGSQKRAPARPAPPSAAEPETQSFGYATPAAAPPAAQPSDLPSPLQT
jgi:TetR/AcrR family transcriptional repressor of lmrAB and yxaGH operons